MSSLKHKSFGELFTFTRASVATYWGSDGTLQTAAVDEPRVDYNPATLAVRGLLIEKASTNLLLNSASLSTQDVTTTNVAHTLSFYGTGTITLSGTSTAGPLVGTAATSRVTLGFTPTAGTLTLTVSGSVLYAQLETGAIATSYITTTGTTATRSRDICSTTSINWFNAPEGTLYVEYLQLYNDTNNYRIVQADDGDETDRFLMFLSNGTRQGVITTSSAAQTAFNHSGFVAGTVQKHVMAWDTNDCASYASGGYSSTDSSATMPSGITTFRLGAASSSGNEACAHIRAVKFYPRRLTNTELAALVA